MGIFRGCVFEMLHSNWEDGKRTEEWRGGGDLKNITLNYLRVSSTNGILCKLFLSAK